MVRKLLNWNTWPMNFVRDFGLCLIGSAVGTWAPIYVSVTIVSLLLSAILIFVITRWVRIHKESS